MKLGDFLRLQRSKNGDIPLHTVADKAGLNPSVLSRIELGTNKTPPTKDILTKLSKGYSVSIETLVSVIYDIDIPTQQPSPEPSQIKKVPIVPIDMAIRMILGQEPVSEHTSIDWVYLPYKDAYYCAIRQKDKQFYPYIQKEDILVIRSVHIFRHGDWVAVASADMKQIQVMIMCEYQNQLILRTPDYAENPTDIPITIDIKKRMLGIVSSLIRNVSI